ncbi:cadherin EGF LAG seven-pass G-type receptor 3 isoform X8 [Acinonyx jubatus]|uniref:Cadherin EGF LAG seven-pass G-type receptor 3 isoform X8 n=2 Tax=Acinonyx jubatus TaxID=32536 RepID=A0A6J1XPV8_ACIJB|nr:cadherin EGF LAG seven-pass G-type receptor 3 isoform X8 [Acinonyx jubatus]
MATTASEARFAMRNGLYHRIWGFGAEVERTIAEAGSHVGAAGGGSRVGDAVVGTAKAGAARQRGSGCGVDGAQRAKAVRSDRPRGGEPGRRQGPGRGPERRGGPKARTGARGGGGRVGRRGVMARRPPWWGLRGPTTPLLLLLLLLSLFPLSREELGVDGGQGWDPGVAAATGPGARTGGGALALCPETPGVQEDEEPGLGVREPVFLGLRGGRQSAQSGRGLPEQPDAGLGAKYGVQALDRRGQGTGQGPGALLCWRPEVSSCGRTGPLRKDSQSPEALPPGVPSLRNSSPFPLDLLVRPRGYKPVFSQRNPGRGTPKKVGTTRCCGELWAPRRRGQSERTATSRAARTAPQPDCPPRAIGCGPGLDSAPLIERTAPESVSALRESRTALEPTPERMRSRGLFRRRFLPQRPGPRPPGIRAQSGIWRIPTASRIRPRRAANRHPQFPQYNYQALVPENEAAGTAVLRVVAQDPDAGEAGRLVYSLAALMNSRSLELFSIDPLSGLIRTEAALDRESMERHYLRVTAQDHGSPRLSATTMVAVTVTDRNDHAPVFEQAQYRETLRENVEEGYPILQLRATDGDAPPNANLRYRFVGPPAARAAAAAAFEIDPRSGLISTSGRVDREHMESYELVVEASDQGQEPGPRSATVRVHITVLDENDNAPQFSEKRYVAQVREDVRPHTVVLRVTATDRDKDANGLVHYNIISGNSRGHFAIDSLTGEIQVVAPLDFEAEREYALRIRAQDAGRPPLSNNTGLASIQVVDINDHTPIFVSTPFQVSVLENAPLGHSVIHIQAVDADHGENARLEYSLTGVAPDMPFVINSATGWVSVSGPLDRESVEHYFFGVEARDHGTPPLSASASVTVTVLDVNDNRPEFTMKEYHLRLNEDAAVGTTVVSVTAVDRDANSAISYQITGGNTRNRFAISTQGGVGLVTLALPLDYKQERYFKLVLTASDRALHDHCYVHINITDANTHRPVFQSAHYSVSVNEDRPVGSTVVVISASDDDVGENARITYLLEDNLPQFRIDADSGAITLQAPLDYEDQVTYTLAITARDNGIPQKADTTYVEVMVNDVNDNAPQFVASHYTGLVSEDAPPFTSVLQISATDRDAHANGRVQYTFQNGEDGDGDFTIEPTSGIVRTVRRLDREAVPVYELTAYAVDRGVPPLRTPVSIQVTVQDVNDNAPVFPAEEFEVRVKENSIVGSVVAQITAVDPDEGPNAHIMYQIVEGNIPELFQMDIFSGELTALIDLDYEARQEYVIVVQATSAPLVSRATVHVRLVDQNDNSPVLNNFQILFNNYVSNRSDTFPSGVIGRIPAYDPDVSDHLFYSFERGNELQLLVVNQTSGELRLSRKLDNNRPLVASMLVTVTDGLHSVTAQCVLRVVIITEELLANSLTVRLENMWQERFLSPLLGHFLEGVAAVLATPAEDVFIFNIQNDTDVGGTVLNVSFSALAPRGAGAGAAGPWFSSEELQEQLYVRRSALAARSLLDVLPFDDNVCLREPCENYMKCVSVLRFDSSAPFLASASTLFRPIQPIAGLRCRCPPGFTGDFCETELDLCYSNPCRNGGACARREGGYTCVCRPRFTGEDCELDTEAGRCVPGVCRNGGTCADGPDGGFRCQCPAGGAFEGPRCEVAARSFPPSSFVMFRGLRQRFHLTLSLSFATVQASGLLFYNGRLNEKHDFLALELVAGQVRLTYSTGESNTVVSPTVPGGLSDGQWHTVHLRYYNKPRTDALGGAQGPSKDKVAVLSVDDCDVAVALQFGAEIGNYSCAAAGMQTSSKKSLDLTGPLLLGGVPNLPENFPVSHKEFIGCMRDLYIDGRRMDMAAFVANNGTMAGCQAKLHFCDSGPCKNSGFCSERWGGFSCDCPVGFGGKDCRLTMAHPHHFRGNGTLSWDFGNDMTVSVPWYLGLAFRTRATQGVLMQVQAGPHSTLLCQLDRGLLSVTVTRGSGRAAHLLLDQVTVSDGRWHDLRLELQEEPGGRRGHHVLMVSLDYSLFQDTMAVGSELQGLKVKRLHVGGLPPSSEEEVPQGLVGCIQGVWLGPTPSGSPALLPPSHRVNVEPGCIVTNACASGPCPPHADCRDLWQTFSCTCWPGYYGPGCVDACLLNPCQNQGSCRHLPGAPHGYTCDCAGGYFGHHCEHRMDQQCPRGWWGSPTCGPCNCDVHKGFDPNCNKTNGQCHCKEFHYRPRGSDSCLPCDCYPVGSTSRSCAPHSGQCPCRPGALGRQCNSCDSPFAEVTASGCRVLYDACPKSLRSGVWWPQTKFGMMASVPCPRGALGAAVRLCDEDQGWLEPDLFNCTSPAFRELNLLLDGLELNKTALDTVEAKKLAQRLREVTGHTDHYFSQDVRVTARLLAHLLAFESHQQGFGLTATQDAHFNENLLWAGSALLAPETGDLWAALGQRAPGGSPGSAGLVQHLEEYAATLARNMELTYLNPVGLVTPNIMLSIDRMEHPSPTRGTRRYPRYHSNLFRGQDAWDPHTHVLLPPQSPRPSPPEVLSTSSSSMENYTSSSVGPPPVPPEPEPEPGISIVILLVYRTLGGLLPAQFQAERRGARLPQNPVMNSPVVSVAVFHGRNFLRGVLESPISLEFRLLQTANRSKAICVQWDPPGPADQHGMWTARDCELVHRNGSHARCRCSRTGTFGVLMDASPRERLEGDLELLAVFTHVVMAVSVAALLLTVAVLLSLRSLKSNMRAIHANVAAALGVAELLFLLGIHRTHNQLVCTAVAILLHYFFLSTFAWLLVQGLHLYRMQVEPRNVDRGAMRFYHALGWGVPAVLLGLAVGLDPEGYGNPDFCWISVHEPLMWSFAGPVILVIVMNGTMLLLTARTSCSTGQREAKKTSVLRSLRSCFLLLLLVSASWLFGLLAVNHSVLAFHYLHAALCGLQGLAVLLLFCVLNADARAAWTPACLARKAAPEEARPAPGTGHGAYNNTALFEESGLIRITLGASTVSSVSSARSGRTQDQDSQRGRGYLRDNVLVRHGSAADHTDHSLQAHAGPTDLDVAMFHRDAGGAADSDSDSDLSLEEERSLSIPSSESEDNGRTRGRFQRPLRRAAQSERLLTHPKDVDGNDLLSYWPALGECEATPCALQTWGSERRLGLDTSKDAANNNQPDLALTSGDETSLGRAQRQRKGILKNRLQYPLVPQTRGAPELSWCRAATLGHRAVPAASYGRIYAGGATGSLSQPASRYSSREQLDLLLRRQLSRERLEEAPAPMLHPLSRPGSQERLDAAPGRLEPRDRGSTLPRRQPPRDYPGARAGRFGSRDALDLRAPCEWLSTLPLPHSARNLDPQPPPLPLSPQRQLSRDPLLPSRPLDSLSRRSNSGEQLDRVPSRHPSREGLGPPPQLLRVREDPASGPSHGPSTEQLDILSSILASFNSSALSSSVQSSSTPSGPHITATPSATASALGPSTPRSATSHSISELSPDSDQRDTEALLPVTQAMELRKRNYYVERPLLNQEQLEELGCLTSATETHQWRTWFQCSYTRARALLLQHLPVLAWLPRYPVRDWLLGDLLAGLSVAIMQLPQGLAYALLAGLPPVFGLYSSFYPVFIYFLFGTSRHISVGTFAVMSVMVGSVTESLAPDEDFLQAENATVDEEARDAARVQLAATLSVLVGLFQVGLGLVHFGFVVTYLSEPLVRGYTTAASIQVFVSQLKYVFGLQLSSRSGPLSLIYTVLEVCWKLPQSVVGTVVTALVAGVVLVLVKLLNDKLQRHLPLPLPGELLTLIGATGISYGVGLKRRFGVDVVGNIPAGLVPPVAPNPQLFASLVGYAFTIAVVGFAIAISLGKIFALRHGYRVDSNQELVALGLSNLVGGIFRCFPVSCSMSRSLVQESTGGNTQVAGAVSSLFILIIIVKLGELFQDLPKAVLAAVIIVNLKGMLKQFTDICSLWKANRVDLLIWLVTFVATILLNLDLGLAVAVVFSLLLVVFRTQLPRYSILGQVPDTDIYRDVAEYSEAREVPGVKIFRSSATMYFANAELYSDALKQRCGVDVDHLISRKKKLVKKQEQKLKRLKKLQKQTAASKDTSVSIEVNSSTRDMESNNMEDSKAEGEGSAMSCRDGGDHACPERKATDLPAQVSTGNELEGMAASGQEDAKAPDVTTLKALGLPQPHFHSLILDLGALSFVDTVCLKSLKNIFRDFREIEVEVYMAACHTPVVAQLEAGHFFDASITKQHLFASVHDAVLFALQHPRSSPASPVLMTKL